MATYVNPDFNWNAWYTPPPDPYANLSYLRDGIDLTALGMGSSVPSGANPTTQPTGNQQPVDDTPQWVKDLLAAQAAAAAEARAALERQRTSAFDTLNAMFKTWGIDMDGTGLAAQVRDWVWGDKSEDAIIMEFRKSDAYNKRFTGMADLVKRAQFMSEAEYISLERDMRNVMNSWNIPKGFYDDYTDFGRFIANGVSVKEIDDRIRSAQTFLDTGASSEYKDALRALGIDDTGLLAYVLDGDRAQSIITQQMKQTALAGAANQFGFDIDAAESDRYSSWMGQQFDSIGVDQRAALEKTLAELGTIAMNDERLASIDREAFQREDTLDAELMNDQSKRLASQRRALREAGRFSGSSAVTTGSLSRNTGS